MACKLDVNITFAELVPNKIFIDHKTNTFLDKSIFDLINVNSIAMKDKNFYKRILIITNNGI